MIAPVLKHPIEDETKVGMPWVLHGMSFAAEEQTAGKVYLQASRGYILRECIGRRCSLYCRYVRCTTSKYQIHF